MLIFNTQKRKWKQCLNKKEILHSFKMGLLPYINVRKHKRERIIDIEKFTKP